MKAQAGCFTIFYADDLAIGSTELDNVKNAMFVLEKYCQRNSLKVNVGKTKVVKHRKGRRLARTDQLFFNNTEIEFKDSFEHLGIVLPTKFLGSKHLEHLKKKAYAASCSIQSKVQLRKICFKSSVRLYESVIFSRCFQRSVITEGKRRTLYQSCWVLFQEMDRNKYL